MLSVAEETALRQIMREYSLYGFKVGVTSYPLTVFRPGRGQGQIIGIDPAAFATPAEPEPAADTIVNVCPEVTASGCPTGRLWITWVDSEGNTTCELTECDTCEGTAAAGCFDGGGGGGSPPAGDGIVTVSGGAWGTPGPLTGDVTTTGAGLTTTIANDAVTLAKMADVATSTVFYRKTAGTGDPEVNTLATLKADLGLTGTNSGDQTITLTGDVTGSGTGSFAATIANDAVSNAKLRNSAALSVIGRSANSTGDPADIAGATVGHVLQVLAGPTLGFGYANLSAAVVTGSSTTLSTTSGTYVDVTGWTFTASAAGDYLIIATGNGVVAASNAGATVKVRFLKNGATFTGSTWPDMYAPTGSTIYQEIGAQAMLVTLAASDVVKGQAAYTYTGVAQNYNLNDPTLVWVRIK